MNESGQNRPKQAITTKQTRAVAALLASPTLTEAARVAGVGERTLRTWLNQPHFKQALAEAEAEALAEAARRLAADSTAAAIFLRQVLDDPTAPVVVRVNAAKSLLQLAPGFRESASLERRLSQLEKEGFL